jgi:uncharacterized protein
VLTGDLVRVRVRKGVLVPTYIDPTNRPLLDAAATLCDAYLRAAEHKLSRADLDAELEPLYVGHKQHWVLRGLAKLLADGSDFDTMSPLTPLEVREAVFSAAARIGPLALEPGPFERPVASDVYKAVAEDLGVDPAVLRSALYADRREEQRLLRTASHTAESLLHRYNVSLVQALLLRAASVRIRLERPTAPRMKALFRYVKFHRLLHSARRDGKHLEVVLDGPASLFSQSTRYGRQLANFFPSLLLCRGSWSMEATVLWTKRNRPTDLRVDHTTGLKSHLRDRGAWRSKAVTHFAKQFRAANTHWELHEGSVPVDLGGKAVVFPDFTFRRGKDEVHLDVLGFWRKDALEKRLSLLDRYAPGTLVLAVSRKLRGCRESLQGYEGPVVDYAEVLSPTKVIATLDAVAARQAAQD